MAKLKMITFGCQANEADSEKIAGVLGKEGYELTHSAAEADLILINTCSIREKAEQKVFSLLGRFQELKRQRPGLRIGLCGCLAQREGERLKTRFPYLDIVVGPGAMIYELPAILEGKTRGPEGLRPKAPLPLYVVSPRPRRESGFRAWVSIMEGCNYFCTFCIVPYTRGPERSRPPEDILAEVAELVATGYREITLLGQTVNAYGKNLRPRTTFAELLRQIDALTQGRIRVRFTSSHPKDMRADLIEAMAELPSVCEHLHLPVQSGSNRLLKRMRRLYGVEEYLEITQALRTAIPGIALSTDIIVGFPGEGEADFEETMELLRTVRYDSIFAFKYSPRPLTPAERFDDQVPEAVKAERLKHLLALQETISLERHQALVGARVKVLIDQGPNRKEGSLCSGRTRTNAIVHFARGQVPLGTEVVAQITDAYSYYLKGTIVGLVRGREGEDLW